MATPKHHNNNNNKSSSPATPLFDSLRKSNWSKSRFISTTTTPNNHTPPSSAAKNVTLLDWWLIKVQSKGTNSSSICSNSFKFGVGGKAFDGGASMYFCSGEIVKRHDEMNLETVEGITITLASLLNRFRTLENGFPAQVCDHFFLGFPFDWEEFGAQYFGEQSVHGAHSSKGTRMSLDDMDDRKCLLSSFDDIPVTRLYDHMMVTSGDYNECQLTRNIFDHILSEYGGSSAQLNEEDTDQIIAEDSLPNETTTPLHASEENNKPLVAGRCSLDKALQDQSEDKDANVILDDMPMGTTDNFSTIHSQSKMDEDVHKLSKFVVTRRKTRSETLKNNQQEGLPLNTSMHPATTPRTSAKQYGDTITVTKPKHLGNVVTTRRGTISELSMSSQDLNFSSAILDPGVTAPIAASEVSGNRSRIPQIDMEDRTLTDSESSKLKRNLNSSSGVLTRSKARLKKLRSDPEDVAAEPDVAAEESAVNLVQTKKICDPCPTSEAEKSEKDASGRHVTNKFPILDSQGVRRSKRKRNVAQYHEP